MDIFHGMWEKGLDVSKPDLLTQVLNKQFKEDEIKQIMENANGAYKQRLNDNTKEALDRGAFGCPWFWVRNSKGDEEPFFGSDRYVPVRLMPPLALCEYNCIEHGLLRRRGKNLRAHVNRREAAKDWGHIYGTG